MSSPKQIVISGGFDDIKSHDLRFLQEASALGELTVLLWTDDMMQQRTRQPPKFPLAERIYFLNAVRYITRVVELDSSATVDLLPEIPRLRPDIWADMETEANPVRAQFARDHGIAYCVFKKEELQGYPEPPPARSTTESKKAIVTGSFDWFHSGHVRFLEEVSHYGHLYVVVGRDANIELLKGKGHPLLPEEERRYVVGAIKFVQGALLASGCGWLDAEPEIERLKPDIYAVNEDGDKGGKREYCHSHGIQYLVLKRAPAAGLPRRTSTDLRGF